MPISSFGFLIPGTLSDSLFLPSLKIASFPITTSPEKRKSSVLVGAGNQREVDTAKPISENRASCAGDFELWSVVPRNHFRNHAIKNGNWDIQCSSWLWVVWTGDGRLKRWELVRKQKVEA